MIIRLVKEEEFNAIIDIWYKVSIIAHNFISDDFWYGQRKDMLEKYIPASETYVIIAEDTIVGFISMIKEYIAAFFISTNCQNKGYGKKLLDFIKVKNHFLKLKVYKKNSKAIDFYLKNNFSIENEQTEELTNEAEFVMVWNRK
jgi:putative acetyltransferase